MILAVLRGQLVNHKMLHLRIDNQETQPAVEHGPLPFLHLFLWDPTGQAGDDQHGLASAEDHHAGTWHHSSWTALRLS